MMVILSVTTTYQNGRWEVAVRYSGGFRVGTGSTPEEAVSNLLIRIFKDVEQTTISVMK